MSLTIFVPPNEPTTHKVTSANGVVATYLARVHNGHLVIDLPRPQVTALLFGSNGRWMESNPEMIAWLGNNDPSFAQYGEVFPGKDRPPPIPVATEVAAPIMVALRAPANVNCYSFGGVEYEIAADGMIEVENHVAEILYSHGFTRAVRNVLDLSSHQKRKTK